MRSKIAIVGAGPAGTSLAIRLSRIDCEVVLIEREKFPRQKLCGEFISPECLTHFVDLGVLDSMLAAGGEQIRETRFYEMSGRSIAVPSTWFGANGCALSLSRAEMDNRLLDRAKSVGVTVLEESTVVDAHYSANGIGFLKVRGNGRDSTEISADLFVDATGRSGALTRLIEKHGNKSVQVTRKPRFVAFKNHCENVQIERGLCEIYSFPGGYGGVSGIEGGLVNHCFIIKADAAREFKGKVDPIIEKMILKNKRAAETLADARAVRDWLAVTIDTFGANRLRPGANVFSVGDAAAFIDPFTGSGMLMALDSAEIFAKCLIESRGFDELGQLYTSQFHKSFDRRLRICSVMRHAAFLPNAARIVISALSASDIIRQVLVRSTRIAPSK